MYIKLYYILTRVQTLEYNTNRCTPINIIESELGY